ncbi:hypothetical protein ACS0TY_012244 [Phlomoides rotata]
MEFKFLHIFALLSVAIVASHATLPSEEYWNSVLPNTPMPKAVKDLVQPVPEWLENDSTSVGVGKGGVNVNTGKPGGSGTSVGVHKGGVNVNTGKPGGSGTSVGVGKGGVNVNTGKPGSGTNVGVGRGGVYVGTHPRRGKPVHVNVSPFIYNYAATKTQLNDNPNVALFFLEKDLHTGKNINLQFSKNTNEATFLPREVADSLPFSSNKLPEIFDKFSVNPSSDEATVMKKTIKECEEKAIKGEEKLCATSLESMVDFTTSKLGKDVRAISTNAENGARKEYRIVGVKKAASEKSAVVCHRQEYAYAVFYCHKTDTTDAYEVAMVGAGGSRAVAVCHKDTAAWNPKHLAFQVLNVKPGTVPICHFLPEDHIVWVSKN